MTNQYRAHETVTAQAANDLFFKDGVDWPVSGDLTTIHGKENDDAILS